MMFLKEAIQIAKYYLIYLTDDKLSSEFCKNEDNLYAYTTDRDMLKRFKSQRNMNLFKIKKEDLDTSGCNMLAKMFKDQILTDADIMTSTIKNGIIDRAIITLSITMEEQKMILATSEYMKESLMMKYTVVDPEAFKEKYFEAFDILKYTDVYSMYDKGRFLKINADEKTSVYDPYVRQIMYDYDDLKYVVKNYLSIDMFMLFLHDYGALMLF